MAAYVARMTSSESVTAAGADASANEAVFRTELIETVRLAAPMALTQLGQVVMMTTDMILLGRLGDKVVAATALAHTVLFAAFTIGMGLVAAVAPLASQAFGAREPRMVRRALRVGLWAAVHRRNTADGDPAVGRGHSSGARPDTGSGGAWRIAICQAWAGAWSRPGRSWRCAIS